MGFPPTAQPPNEVSPMASPTKDVAWPRIKTMILPTFYRFSHLPSDIQKRILKTATVHQTTDALCIPFFQSVTTLHPTNQLTFALTGALTSPDGETITSLLSVPIPRPSTPLSKSEPLIYAPLFPLEIKDLIICQLAGFNPDSYPTDIHILVTTDPHLSAPLPLQPNGLYPPGGVRYKITYTHTFTQRGTSPDQRAIMSIFPSTRTLFTARYGQNASYFYITGYQTRVYYTPARDTVHMSLSSFYNLGLLVDVDMDAGHTMRFDQSMILDSWRGIQRLQIPRATPHWPYDSQRTQNAFPETVRMVAGINATMTAAAGLQIAVPRDDFARVAVPVQIERDPYLGIYYPEGTARLKARMQGNLLALGDLNTDFDLCKAVVSAFNEAGNYLGRAMSVTAPGVTPRARFP